MICPACIEILAADDNGLGSLIPLVIIGIIWLVGAVVSKAKKKEAEEKANRIRQQKAIPNNNNKDEDGWAIVAPPPQKPPPPMQQPRPASARKPSIQQFVKPKAEDSHAVLTQPKAVEHLQHVQPEPLPVLHAEGELSSSHLCADDQQEQPDVSLAKTRVRQKLTSVKEIQPSVETSSPGKALSGLARLADPKSARAAMVFHEILSSPKALRDEDNMWD